MQPLPLSWLNLLFCELLLVTGITDTLQWGHASVAILECQKVPMLGSCCINTWAAGCVNSTFCQKEAKEWSGATNLPAWGVNQGQIGSP